ncbi:glycosyltransferase family 2 protein [Peribacillus simplex]|uniref:glycosyltransferase family 2 protein n=1 Tax=Peribacillus simplex TaxID=1478 RepID=UPI0028534F29|nr:glycosyltransferase family 2 protein [Peribacillus simplex]MDR4925434.1 glycosyltransferase family 2 protein [Peribacillus simplex]
MTDTSIIVNNQNDKKVHYKSGIQPQVSIVVATYRRDSALNKALLSLICQTYKFIEVIVVDDNADDIWNKKVVDNITKVQSQFHQGLIYIQNKKNMGSAETRNIGIKAASGEYITFLDDDDIYLPNKIKNQLEHMLEMDSDYSLTDLDLYNESDRLIEKRNRKYIKKTSKDDLFRYHFMNHMTGTDTIMFKRIYLLSFGGFSPIDVGDEFYLMQKAIEAGGKFSYLPVCDIKAYVHTKTDGLSSGESKINGENALYEYKKKYFSQFSKKDIRNIKMRHYAVLAFAELRRKKAFAFLKNSFCSFITSPVDFIKLILATI